MRAKSLKINLLVYESHHHRRTLGKEGFEAITDYIITKPQLCGKLISLYVPPAVLTLCRDGADRESDGGTKDGVWAAGDGLPSVPGAQQVRP
jgi:hypothetical protein